MTNADPDDFAREVREMRDATTPGPWTYEYITAPDCYLISCSGSYGVYPVNGKVPRGREACASDAAFTAALPDIADAFLRQHEECKRLEARVKELEEALLAAGKSLRTLANTAGTKDALLEDFTQVRGYANSRAIVVERIFAPNEGGE